MRLGDEEPDMTEGNRDAIPDEELVERSLNGEEDAFRLLYEKYRQPVYSAVYRIVPYPEEARDVTQEIFIAVYRSLATWNPQRARFLPWIYRVATNRAIDCWRRRQRRAEVPLSEISETHAAGLSSCRETMESIERTMEHKERVTEVRRFLEALPQPQRQFIILRYCDGLKLKEIADKEGYKLGTVKSVLHRATHTMRLKLMRLYRHRPVHSRDAAFEVWPWGFKGVSPSSGEIQ
jgi:RNA polymerase sigma-70 factor (ECF subfamily)